MIASMAQDKTGLTYSCSNIAVTGMRAIGNADTMQAAELAVYTANFGGKVRPQRSTFNTKNKEIMKMDAAIGGSRGGHIICPPLEHSLMSALGEIYHNDFCPYFHEVDLPPKDRWYAAKWPNGRKQRNPRFFLHTRIKDWLYTNESVCSIEDIVS
jgi:hypothetical protein